MSKGTLTIHKGLITRCTVCEQVKCPTIPDPEQTTPTPEGHVWIDDSTPMIDDPNWQGVMGYEVEDEDSGYWRKIVCCETCMTKMIKAVGLINSQKLQSVKL